MTVTATRLRRLELWSGLQCAGGVRLAIWTEVLAAAIALSLGLDSSLTVQVPLDDPASVTVDRWQVVRVWGGDTAWDEWIVTDVTRDDTSNVLTFSATRPTLLLGRRGLVEERTPDGRVRHELDRVGLTPSTLLQTLVIEPLQAQGIDWVQAGVIVPTQLRDLSIAWLTPLQVLSLLAETCGCELQLRRVGVTAYAIDLLDRVGADAPDLDVRAARNLLEFSQAEALSEHATVITPKGANIDGESATIAEAVWTVTAVSGATVTLADVTDGPGPIGFDAQLDGLQLELPSGVTVPIVGSTFASQQLVCAPAPAVSVGATVRIVDALGDDLVSLPCPPAVREYGPVAGVMERADLPGHRNLVPNPVLRAWPGAGSTPPDGWATVGSVVLSRLTTGPQITRGVSALQVVADAAGEGVTTPLAPITTTAERPFLSGYVTLWITSGTVRVEIVATTGAGERVYPLTGSLATSAVTGQQVDLGLAGIDAHAAGITAARLRVVAHSITGATCIVESAQLTRSAAQLPFVEGSGANLLWHAANAKLETSAVPRLRTTLRLVDLARLDPRTFGPDCTIRLGQRARVVLPRRGLDGTARVVRVEQNLLRDGDGAITLSDAPQDLTGSLARATWRPRPVPAPPIIVVAGEVSASTAFDAAGALTILVVGPAGAESLRAAVSTSAIPSAATVDAATGSLRADGTDVAALTAAGPFSPGQIVYIAVRAYLGGLGTRVLQLTDAADAADAAQGPSLEVRLAQTDTQVTVTYAAIGTVTYRVNDVPTATPSSPFVLARPAAGSRPLVVVLYATRNTLVQSEPIVIPAIGVNTVTPDLVVVPAGDSAFTVSAFDPSGAGLTVVRRMTLTGCTAVGFVGAGPHVLTQGQTVQLVRPLARNPGVVEFEATIAGNGRASVQRTVAPRDLTGVGIEVLSNPEFRAQLPRRAAAYENTGAGLVSLSYVPVVGQNTSGVALRIAKAAGVMSPGLGGFTLLLERSVAAQFVADAYREGALYLVTVRASIPVGASLIYASNAYGTGGTAEWLSAQAGTGDWTDYVLRVQVGRGGSFSSIGFFWLSSADDTAAIAWQVARVNWRDLSASERQPVASLTATIIGGDATTIDVQLDITPATSESRVWLADSSEAPTGGSAVDVAVPNGSVWTFPRRGFQLGTTSAFFRGRTPGFELATASVEIPEQGRDTVTPDLIVVPSGDAAFTILAFDPSGAGGTVVREMTLTGCTAVGFTGAGPHVLTQGQTVQLVRPLARNPGVVEFEATLAGSGTGRASAQRSVAPRDLTGLGIEMLSNPEFRAEIPRIPASYDNGSTGLVTLSYEAVSGQNTSGQALVVTKAAGSGVFPGLGGFALALQRNDTTAFVADRYRAGALTLVTLRARIPIGYTIEYGTNPFGVEGTVEFLSAQSGTGEYADYVLRVQVGTTAPFGSIGFFYVNGPAGAVTWRVARINWRDLSTSERQPVAALVARIIGGDADTSVVEVVMTPSTPETRVWLRASTDPPEDGAAVDVEVANASVWSLPRKAFRLGAGSAFFRGRTPGFEPSEAAVVIPEQGRDTVPLTMSVAKVGGTVSTDVLRVTATDPFPQGTGSLTLAILGGGAASLSPAGPLAITSGSPVDITVGKPTSTSQDAVVGFTVTGAGRVSAFREITVAAVRALIPARVEIVSIVQDGVDATTRFRVRYADGAEATTTDIARLDFRDERTPVGGGAPVLVSRSVSRDAANGWYVATSPRVAGDAMRGIVIVAELGITARTEVTFALPPLPATAAPLPRFTSCTVTVSNGPGITGADITMAFNTADAPGGFTVSAIVDAGTDGVTTYVALTTGAVIGFGRLTSAGGFTVATRIRGRLSMLDSAGNEIASRAIPSTNYWSS